MLLGGSSKYDPDLYNKKRAELLKILPTDQSQLPPRRMIDSFDSAVIPIASNPSLRVKKILHLLFLKYFVQDRYLVSDGGVRIGRLLEDMDIFAVHLGR